MLAVVVDDHDMGVTHVIRGDDHLINAARQKQIYDAMGWALPNMSHIPLIHGPDGSKLSKRHAALGVDAYRAMGYLPEAVRNYLCLLGWSPKDNREKIDIDEVVRLFELEKINRRNAAFDLDKCFWLNGQYIAQMSVERFVELARPFLDKANIKVSDQKYLRDVLAIVKEKIKLLKDVPEWTAYFFSEDYAFEPAAIAKVFAEPEAAERLIALRAAFDSLDTWTVEKLESTLKEAAQKLGCKTGDLVHPARVAVSGRSVGPSLYHMLEVMGKDRVLARFDRMRAQLGTE